MKEEEEKFGDIFEDAKDEIDEVIDSLQNDLAGVEGDDLPEDDIFGIEEEDVKPSERDDAPEFDFDDDDDDGDLDDDFGFGGDDDDDDDDDVFEDEEEEEIEEEPEESLEESFKKFVKSYREHKYHRTGSKKFTESEFNKLKKAFKEQLKETKVPAKTPAKKPVKKVTECEGKDTEVVSGETIEIEESVKKPSKEGFKKYVESYKTYKNSKKGTTKITESELVDLKKKYLAKFTQGDFRTLVANYKAYKESIGLDTTCNDKEIKKLKEEFKKNPSIKEAQANYKE
jgi:hypothetical protein